MQKSFGIRPIRPWECQPGGAQRGSQHIPPGRGRALTAQHGTPFYGYLYSDVSELFGESRPQTRRKRACKGISAHNYGTFFKQRINQKAGIPITTDCAGAVYAARGRHAGVHHVRRRGFDLHPRVVLRLAVESGRSVHVSIDADYSGQTRICSIRRTWPAAPVN